LDTPLKELHNISGTVKTYMKEYEK